MKGLVNIRHFNNTTVHQSYDSPGVRVGGNRGIGTSASVSDVDVMVVVLTSVSVATVIFTGCWTLLILGIHASSEEILDSLVVV